MGYKDGFFEWRMAEANLLSRVVQDGARKIFVEVMMQRHVNNDGVLSEPIENFRCVVEGINPAGDIRAQCYVVLNGSDKFGSMERI